MKVTMKDVADHAGVDKATVSRVLHGDRRISEKTRIKVIDSVRTLDYRLDRSAQSLSTHTSALIGVVLREASSAGAFLDGLLRAFANSDYDIIVRSTQGHAARAQVCVKTLEGRGIEGLVWTDAANAPQSVEVPLVCVGFTADGAYSVTAEPGTSGGHTLETGVMVGRMILNVVAGKPVPARDILVART